MKTETSSQAIMAAVYHAYHRADPCHCHGSSKLSEGEILAVFIKKGLVAVADTPHQDALSVENLVAAGALSYDEESTLRTLGITHLPELRFWTRYQILRVPSFGERKADQAEHLAAKFGVLLADGDPVLLEHVKQTGGISSEDDGWRGAHPRKVPETPEEIRSACANGLLRLASQLVADGSSLSRIASRVSANIGKRSQTGEIRRYMTREQTSTEHVRTITRAFMEMIDAKKPGRRTKREQSPQHVAAPVVVESEGNVVRAAFGPKG